MNDGDPVLAQRARVATVAGHAQRAGYVLYGIALVVFFYGLAAGFSRGVSTTVVIALMAGSVVLAPAIIVGYAVRAADRADREDDW